MPAWPASTSWRPGRRPRSSPACGNARWTGPTTRGSGSAPSPTRPRATPTAACDWRCSPPSGPRWPNAAPPASSKPTCCSTSATSSTWRSHSSTGRCGLVDTSSGAPLVAATGGACGHLRQRLALRRGAGGTGLPTLHRGGHASRPPPHVPRLRRSRLLRLVRRPPRHRPLRSHPPPRHAQRRTRRSLALVLHRPAPRLIVWSAPALGVVEVNSEGELADDLVDEHLVGGMALTAVAIAELAGERWDAAADAIHRALEQGRRWGLPWQDADLLTQLALAELGRARAGRPFELRPRRWPSPSRREPVCSSPRPGSRWAGPSGKRGEVDRTAQAENEVRRALALVNSTGATTLEPFIREELGRLRGAESELQEALRLFTAIGAAGHARRLQN